MNTRIINSLLALLVCAGPASAALVTSTNYVGDTGNFSGALINSATWDAGLPSNANPGLVAQTTNTWMGDPWTDFAVRLTGGNIYAAGTPGNLNMRGGATGSGNKTILEIEDLSNTDYSTTNLTVAGTLTMWAQFGQGQELSLLAGYGTVGTLNAISNTNLSTINLRDGKLDIANYDKFIATVNLLAGGTGSIVLGDRATVGTGSLNTMVLNFETGTQASFTLSSLNGTNSAGGYWQFFVGNGGGSIPGGAYIDGALTNDLSNFVIANDGLATTITLVPEPATFALYAGVLCLGLIVWRRRVVLG